MNLRRYFSIIFVYFSRCVLEYLRLDKLFPLIFVCTPKCCDIVWTVLYLALLLLSIKVCYKKLSCSIQFANIMVSFLAWVLWWVITFSLGKVSEWVTACLMCKDLLWIFGNMSPKWTGLWRGCVNFRAQSIILNLSLKKIRQFSVCFFFVECWLVYSLPFYEFLSRHSDIIAD